MRLLDLGRSPTTEKLLFTAVQEVMHVTLGQLKYMFE